MRIQVTQEHIDHSSKDPGTQLHCSLCPIALALKDATRDTWIVLGPYAVRKRDDQKIALPYPVAYFVYQHDAGRLGKPFSFEVEIPE